MKCALCGKVRFLENGVCEQCIGEAIDDDPGEDGEAIVLAEAEH